MGVNPSAFAGFLVKKHYMMRRLIITATVMFLACVSMTYAKTYVVCVGLKDYPGYFNDLNENFVVFFVKDAPGE